MKGLLGKNGLFRIIFGVMGDYPASMKYSLVFGIQEGDVGQVVR